jgi:hypothetical protein
MQRFTWNGSAMVPTRPDAARGVYELARHYWLEEVDERSWISHRHEFAFIADAWGNLPEALMELYPTPEHLRKAALIATGWYRENLIEAGSKEGARRVAAYVKGSDEFAHVVISGPAVIVKKARSQRTHGLDRMQRKEFEASKQAILNWIANLIGVSAEDLQKATAA